MAIFSDAGALVGTWWNQVTQPQARGPITETVVPPAQLTARTDLDEAQQALGQPLPIVIGTGRVDGVYFIGGVETVATTTYTTTTSNDIPPGYVAVSGTIGGQTFLFGPGPRTTTTSTTTYDNRTLAGYVLAYDVFERGYNLIRLEIDGEVVFDGENGIPVTTNFRFYGGRHTTVDPILTQIIGTNPGAYQNFVMIFIEGYPADSPPSISAVISNATGTGGSSSGYITGDYTNQDFFWEYGAGYDPVDGLIYQLSFSDDTGLPETYMHVLSVDSLTELYKSVWPLDDAAWFFEENLAVFPGTPYVIFSYYEYPSFDTAKWSIVNVETGTLVQSGDALLGQEDSVDWLLTMDISAAFPGEYMAIGNYITVLVDPGVVPDALCLVFDAGTETAETFPLFRAIDYWSLACNGPITSSDASFFAIPWDDQQLKNRTVMKITYDGTGVTVTNVFSWADALYATGIAYDPVTNRIAIPRQNLAAWSEGNEDGPGTAYDLVFYDASTYALLQTVTLDKRMSQMLRWGGFRTSNRFFPNPGTVFFFHPYYGNIGTSDLQPIYVIDMSTYTVGTFTENTDNLANPPEIAVLDGPRNVYAVQNWPDAYPDFGVWEVHGAATISPLLIDLEDIITDAMSLAGFGPTDLTFHGIAGRTSYGFVIASDTTVQAVGRSLSDIYGFSWCDTGSGFYFKQAAHGDLFTIDAAFGTADIVERDQPVMSQDEANIRTPSSVEMQYVSKEGQYKPRPTSFNMTTGVLNSITTPKFSTPILFNDAEAQRVVQEKFFEYQEKRRNHTLAVAPENITLLPGDIVSFPSGTRTYITRVEEIGIDLRNMGVEISARDFQTDVESPITEVSNTGPVWKLVRHVSGNVTGQILAVSVGTVTVTAGAAGAAFANVAGQSLTVSVGTVTVTAAGATAVSASVTGQDMTVSVGTAAVTISSTLEYLSTVFDNTNTSPYTFSSVAIGAADSNRKVFAQILVGSSSPTVTSVTIGGVTAPLIVARAGTFWTGIYAAKVPTGTTATIVVTATGTVSECICSVYRTAVPDMVLLDTASASNATTNAQTCTDIEVKTGGFILGNGFSNNSGSPTITPTYNGVDAVSSNDMRATEGSRGWNAASVVTSENASTNDLTFTASGAAAAMQVVAASFFVPTTTAYAPVLASTFSSTTDTTSYSFGSQSYGTANANRQLVICIGWNAAAARAVTSVTVDGNAATLVGAANGGAGGSAIYRYPLAAGTSGTVAITMNGTVTRIGGGIYDTRTRAFVAPIDMATGLVVATSVSAADVEVRDGGFLIATGIVLATETMTPTYNGTDTLVLDQQLTIESLTNAGLFSCLTTEFQSTNDAGFSSASSNGKTFVAASFL